MTLPTNVDALAANAIAEASQAARSVVGDPAVVSRVFHDRLNEGLSTTPLASDYGKSLAVACAATSELASILN